MPHNISNPLSDTEKSVCIANIEVSRHTNFLRNFKTENCQNIDNEINHVLIKDLEYYKYLHILDCHLDFLLRQVINMANISCLNDELFVERYNDIIFLNFSEYKDKYQICDSETFQGVII